MNKTIMTIIFLFSIVVLTVPPVFGIEETRIIISEMDDIIFKSALNSTIISTDGKVIDKLEIANPDEIGQVFVLELKNKVQLSDQNGALVSIPPEINNDLIDALMRLGYQRHHVTRVLRTLPAHITQEKEIITFFLKAV